MTSAGMPYFTSSEGKTYKAQVGNSVTLQCQVENLGKFVLSFCKIIKGIVFVAEKTALHCSAKSMRKYIIQIIFLQKVPLS